MTRRINKRCDTAVTPDARAPIAEELEPALDDSVLGLTPEAQGVIAGRSLPQTAPVVNYNPAPINYNPAPINYNAGGCYNNLGEGVPCRTQF